MIDKKHTLSVLPQDVFDECERITHMWVNARPEANLDSYTISRQDVDQIVSWMLEASALLSDRVSFLRHQDQTGLDALTYFPEYELKRPNPDYIVGSNISVASLFNGETISGDIEDKEGEALASLELSTFDVLWLINQTDTTENGYYRVGVIIGDLIKYREIKEEGKTNDPDGKLIWICDIIISGTTPGEKITWRKQDTIKFTVTDAIDQNRYTVIQQYIKSALQGYVLHKWWALKGISDQSSLEFVNFEKMNQNIRFNSVGNNRLKGKYRRANYHG